MAKGLKWDDRGYRAVLDLTIRGERITFTFPCRKRYWEEHMALLAKDRYFGTEPYEWNHLKDRLMWDLREYWCHLFGRDDHEAFGGYVQYKDIRVICTGKPKGLTHPKTRIQHVQQGEAVLFE